MKKLWEPSKVAFENSHLAKFIHRVNQQHGLNLDHYPKLHQWSIDHPENFWQAVWDYAGIIAKTPATIIKQSQGDIEHTRWFVDATLNFAENLLQRRDNHPAIISYTESGIHRECTFQELFLQVAQLKNYLEFIGVKSGDRVAAMMPNIPDTIIAMLATTSIGAIWSSCSPDFGLPGLVDRFEQIHPTVLFAIDEYSYNGQCYSQREKIAALQAQLPSLRETIIVPYQGNIGSAWSHHSTHTSIEFPALPFNHPLYILYSSGTTGKPKCMVHGAGGTLLQHVKELLLHSDIHNNERLFFYTTCGWMMWNWMVSALAVGATLVLYDGSPFYPKKTALFDLIDRTQINHFGVGAKYLESSEKFHLTPKKTHRLNSLRSILTTGSPLLPPSFNYVYEKIKSDVRLSSISGGSDIISCFALGNPLLPVYCGELQCLGLGMDVRVFDENGKSIVQQKGELICQQAFPSMPLYFWNDAEGQQYHRAYFSKYPNVWAHGDYAEITEHQGIIIYGRSDATLNPGGVRIGTAEIYRQIEPFDEIMDSLVVGKQTPEGEKVILFVILRENIALTKEFIKTIKAAIKKNASPHHVPAEIIAVPDLPRTLNGKIVELAVKKILHGEPITHTDAIANPESLKYFKP